VGGSTGDGWRGPHWIPAESPGGLGAPEVWIDAHTLDHHGGMHPPLVTAVLAGNGGGPWIGRLLQFGNFPGEDDMVTYMIVARRWHSDHNHGQPYYVARVPGQAGETA
jgi:hypothetical protein